MKIKRIIVATTRFSISVVTAAMAYEQSVHEDFSHIALGTSASAQAYIQDNHIQELPGENADLKLAGILPAPVGWIERGAYAEDEGIKCFNHFFDPVYMKPLRFCFFTFGDQTWQWAATDKPAQRHWGLHEARLQQAWAIRAPTGKDRLEAYTKLFYTLGNVLHLVQDMAQPQHTRNDPHGPILGDPVPDIWHFFQPSSVYEKLSADPSWNALIDLGSYPSPTLSTVGTPLLYRDAWYRGSTRGLANFSNRNFVTVDTNLDRPVANGCLPASSGNRYDSPYAPASPRSLPATAVSIDDIDGNSHTVEVRYVPWRWEDHDVGTSGTNDHLSAFSIFDFDRWHWLDAANPTYSLDDSCYRSMAEALMPRAVGWSRAILDGFFRARVSATWEPVATGYDVKVRNESAYVMYDPKVSISMVVEPGSHRLLGDHDLLDFPFGTEYHGQPTAVGLPDLQPGEECTVHLAAEILSEILDADEDLADFERHVLVLSDMRLSEASSDEPVETDTVASLVVPADATRWDLAFTTREVVDGHESSYWGRISPDGTASSEISGVLYCCQAMARDTSRLVWGYDSLVFMNVSNSSTETFPLNGLTLTFDKHFSPDGRWLAAGALDASNFYIALFDAEAPDRQALYPLFPKSNWTYPSHFYESTLAWSGDSNYVALCTPDESHSSGTGGGILYRVDLSTGSVEEGPPCSRNRVSNTPQIFPAPFALSRTGSEIAFAAHDDAYSAIIFVTDWEGVSRRDLANLGYCDNFEIAWSPRGDLIAFGSWGFSGGPLAVIDADSGQTRILKNGRGDWRDHAHFYSLEWVWR